jgi:hypothetical protein
MPNQTQNAALMEALKPCPHCGSIPTWIHHSNYFNGQRLMSLGCCEFRRSGFKVDLVAAWNRRASPTPQAEEADLPPPFVSKEWVEHMAKLEEQSGDPDMTILPAPLPEWAKHDNFYAMTTSEIRKALHDYALAARADLVEQVEELKQRIAMLSDRKMLRHGGNGISLNCKRSTIDLFVSQAIESKDVPSPTPEQAKEFWNAVDAAMKEQTK